MLYDLQERIRAAALMRLGRALQPYATHPPITSDQFAHDLEIFSDPPDKCSLWIQNSWYALIHLHVVYAWVECYYLF